MGEERVEDGAEAAPRRDLRDSSPGALLRVQVLAATETVLRRGLLEGTLAGLRGFDLTLTPAAPDALRAAARRLAPDILLLDLGQAPDVALDHLRALRAEPNLASAEVLLLADASPTPEVQVRAYELGVVEVLHEPLSPSILASRLQASGRRRLRDRGLRAQLELLRTAVDHHDQRLVELVDRSPEMVLEVAPSGAIHRANPVARRALDLHGSAEGRTCLLDRVAPEDRALLALALELGGVEPPGLTVRVPQGLHPPLHLEVHVAEGPRPGVRRMTLRNVTALRRAQAELRTLSDALLHLDEGVALVDEEGIVRFANPALERLLHLPTGRLEGFPLEACFPEGEAPDLAPLEREGRAAGRGALLRPDRDTVPIRWSARSGTHAEDGAQLTAFVVTDLRPELELQERMVHAEKLSAVGKVLSGVAHELQSPLAVVVGYAELIQRAAGDRPAVHRDAERIVTAAHACRDIVKGLLTVARKDRPEVVEGSLEELVRRVVDLVLKPFQKDGVTLVLEEGPSIPTCRFDPGRLQQVVLNLLVNARDALVEQGGGTVRVGLFRHSEDRARLVVSDDGPGVPEELRESIFDPFFTTKEAGKGTGLGLALCRSIVEEHGGELRLAESARGGASFDVLLPLDR